MEFNEMNGFIAGFVSIGVVLLIEDCLGCSYETMYASIVHVVILISMMGIIGLAIQQREKIKDVIDENPEI